MGNSASEQRVERTHLATRTWGVLVRRSSSVPPNMRVQRTRSSPSALRSPLTRHPLGGRSSRQRLSSLGIPSRMGVVAARASLGGECRLMVSRWLRVAASSSLLTPAASVAGNLRPT